MSDRPPWPFPPVEVPEPVEPRFLVLVVAWTGVFALFARTDSGFVRWVDIAASVLCLGGLVAAVRVMGSRARPSTVIRDWLREVPFLEQLPFIGTLPLAVVVAGDEPVVAAIILLMGVPPLVAALVRTVLR